MPTIGRPEAPNNFSKVAMKEKSSLSPAKMDGNGENVKEAIDRLGVGGKRAEFFKDAKEHNKMGKDEFLKLLSLQLQNQDPMNPMDQNKFAGELAQFSQLEQLTNMRASIDKSHKNDEIEEKYLGASFLGKRVLTEGGGIDFKNEEHPVNLNFNLEEKATKVLVRIFDQKGGIVNEIPQENLLRGNHDVNWNGMQFDGYTAAPGKYNFQVLAFDEINRPIQAVTKAAGTVTAAGFENGEIVLTIDGGRKVTLKEIDKIELPDASAGPDRGEREIDIAKKLVGGKPMASVVDQLNSQMPGAMAPLKPNPRAQAQAAQRAYGDQSAGGELDYANE